MTMMASQITSLTIVYSTVYSDEDQRKHQSFVSVAFVWGIHRGPVNSPRKWPVTRKMFPFNDVIMHFWCDHVAFISATPPYVLTVSSKGIKVHDEAIKWKHFPRYWPFVVTGHRWIPRTKASDAEFWCFLWYAPEPKIDQTIEAPVIWGAIALIITLF